MNYGQDFNPYRLFTGIFIPTALAQCPELSSGAKMAYGRLAQFAGEKGECFPAVETLAKEIGVSVRQAQRYLSELEEFNLIRRIHRGSTSSLYRFRWHSIFDGRAEVTETSPLPVTDSSPKENHIEENQLTPRRAVRSPELQTDWPATTWAVAQRQEVDDRFIVRLIETSAQAVVSFGGILGELTDHALSGLVQEAFKGKPDARAGFLLTRVPELIEARLKHEARAKAASWAKGRPQPPPRPLSAKEDPFPPEEKQS